MNALVSTILPDSARYIGVPPELHATTGPFCLSCVGEAEVSEVGIGHYLTQISVLLGRFRLLPDAIACAERRGSQANLCSDSASGFAPNLLIIEDCQQRLCLAGQINRRGLVWSDPVTSDRDARRVVQEASHLRGQAMREADLERADEARLLRFQAAALEGRLVDPVWRGRVVAERLQAA